MTDSKESNLEGIMSIELIQDLTGHTDRVWTVAWSPDGSFLASSGSDKAIRLWAESNNSFICVSILTKAHSKSIRRICWSPCGKYLAAASFDATTSIWKHNLDDDTWKSIVDLDGHDNEVKSVAWSHDGSFLASCGRDRTVWIWERSEPEGDVEVASGWDCSDILNDHSKDVKHVVWHPNQNILVSCSYDDTIKFFHKGGDQWKCFQTLTSHTSTVWSADFSASGEYLVSCSDDKTLRVWRNHAHERLPDIIPDSWKCISVIQGYHSRTVYDVSWCRSNELIASASGDNSIAIYKKSVDETSKELVYTCAAKRSQSHDCDVNTIAWNNKTGLLASGGDDSRVKIWKYQDDKGMTVLTCREQLLTTILKMSNLTNVDSAPLLDTQHDYDLLVNDYENLLNLIHSLQQLQSELGCFDEEANVLKKLLDLNLLDRDLPPVELTNVLVNGDESSVISLTVNLKDFNGSTEYKFNLKFNNEKFPLYLPKRSGSFIVVAQELFVLDKTGDLFKILDNGKPHFLLGHLFMFTDIKFVTKCNNTQIAYVISSDRDEKIRISNYPDTYNIERYCFGHEHFIRRLLVVNDDEFISLDCKDNVNLWNIAKIKELRADELLKPSRSLVLGQSVTKRQCLNPRLSESCVVKNARKLSTAKTPDLSEKLN